MAIGTKLGTAYVSVEADASKFGAGLVASIRKELAATEKAAKAAGKEAGDAFIDGMLETIRRKLPVVRGQIQAMLRGLKIKTKVTVDVDVDIKGAGSAAGGGLGARIAGQLKSEIGGGAFSAIRGIQGAVGKLKELFGGGLGGFAVKLLLGVSAGGALLGVFNAVGRELVGILRLSALAPGVFATMAAAVIPLKVAWSGVGDAIDAALSGNKKKLDELTKGMSRSAKDFVNDFARAKPFFDSLKLNTQERFFVQLTNIVPKLKNALGPSLFAGFGIVASKAGQLVNSIVDRLAQPRVAAFLDRLFITAGRLIDKIQGPVGRLIDSLLNAADTALPFIDRIGDKVGGMVDKFAAFITENIENGNFETWIEDGIATFTEFKDLLVEAGKLLGVMFDDGNQEGESFIVNITDLMEKLRKFLETPDGQLALEGIATMAKIAGATLVGLAAIIGTIIIALADLVAAVERALRWLGILDERKGGRSPSSFLDPTSFIPAQQGFGRAKATTKKARADGGIILSPETSLIGEAGTEVVIPLTRPGRARQLADASGLTSMLGSGGGDTYIFYLGEEQVEAKMVRVARRVQGQSVRAASYGAAPAA